MDRETDRWTQADKNGETYIDRQTDRQRDTLS